MWGIGIIDKQNVGGKAQLFEVKNGMAKTRLKHPRSFYENF